MKKIALVLTLLLTLSALFSCGKEPSPSSSGKEPENGTPEENEPTEKEETPQKEEKPDYSKMTLTTDHAYDFTDAETLSLVKTFGRTEKIGTGLAVDWTASGIEFCAVCEGKVRLSVFVSSDTYFTVYLDGVRQKDRFFAQAGNATLDIAEFYRKDAHTVKIVKQTEAKVSRAVFKTLTFRHGDLLDRPADGDLYFEFIGDSITCGYGNLVEKTAVNPGNAECSDGTSAYAYLAAEALGADYSIVSVSGIGVAKGYTAATMPEIYGKTSYYRNESTAYTPARTPDVVIVNLGTNDKTNGADPAVFKEKAQAFVEQIRALYGKDVPIVWCGGMMGAAMSVSVKELFASLGGTAAGLYTLDFFANQEGGGNHPNGTSHVAYSLTLSQFLSILLGLETD